MKWQSAVFVASLTLTIGNVLAADQTVKLSVPGMNCASCPIMVKGVIRQVGGVKAVSATMKDRSATVTFDDTVTSVDALTDATASIGFPSTAIPPDSRS